MAYKLLLLILSVAVSLVYSTDVDVSGLPCKFLGAKSRNDGTIDNIDPDDLKINTFGGEICLIQNVDIGSTSDAFSKGFKVEIVQGCPNMGYFITQNEFKDNMGNTFLPVKNGGDSAMTATVSPAFKHNEKDGKWSYTPKSVYKITIVSDLKGGVAQKFFASVGEIKSSTAKGTSGGKSGTKCFDSNLKTSDAVTYEWLAPEKGAGTAYFSVLLASDIVPDLVRFDSGCTSYSQASSDPACTQDPGLAQCQTSQGECDVAKNTTTNLPIAVRLEDMPRTLGARDGIYEGFVLDPAEILSSNAVIIALVIVGALLLLAAGAILFYARKKKKRENGGEGDAMEAPQVKIERAAVLPEVGGTTKENPRSPLKERSWIQRVARRANEFGRQVPENVQIEDEIYDDYVDTVMTFVLWITLFGLLIFVIFNEFTNPENMSVAFCPATRDKYCNNYYGYSDLATCGEEQKNTAGGADKSDRSSICGLRSTSDHLLSIFTNYGALSGFATSICRSIANTWKGSRRKRTSTI